VSTSDGFPFSESGRCGWIVAPVLRTEIADAAWNVVGLGSVAPVSPNRLRTQRRMECWWLGRSRTTIPLTLQGDPASAGSDWGRSRRVLPPECSQVPKCQVSRCSFVDVVLAGYRVHIPRRVVVRGDSIEHSPSNRFVPKMKIARREDCRLDERASTSGAVGAKEKTMRASLASRSRSGRRSRSAPDLNPADGSAVLIHASVSV